MAWDAVAENMAVNVIAKVEGAGAWDAINYNDPFTIGLMQWFGIRGADLLNKMKVDHPTEYANVAASVRNDLDAHGVSNWWASRYLTRTEGASIKPLLRASKDTQSSLVQSDIVDYKDTAERIGMNPDTNTNTVIFFCVMYHQTPARAINLMKRIGMNSTLELTWKACLNEPVFGRYRTRYTDAYNYIKSGNAPVIIDLNDDDEEGGDDGVGTGPDDTGRDSIFDGVRTSIKRITVSGDQLLLHLADDTTAFAVPTGTGTYLINAVIDGGDVPETTPGEDESDPTPSPDPDPPTGDEAEDTRNKLVKFMTDRIGKYAYSQGPSRLTPDKNNMTDCSGLTRYAYLSVTGKDIGTYTDAQLSNKNTRLIESGGGGNSPTESKLKKGDLVISRRYGTASNRSASHVEIYMGGGQIIGHGGPMKGPIIKNLAARTADKQKWWVKRLNSL